MKAVAVLLCLALSGCARRYEVDIKHPFVMRGIQCEEHADLRECSCVITDKILDANRKTYIYVCKQPSPGPVKVSSLRELEKLCNADSSDSICQIDDCDENCHFEFNGTPDGETAFEKDRVCFPYCPTKNAMFPQFGILPVSETRKWDKPLVVCSDGPPNSLYEWAMQINGDLPRCSETSDNRADVKP